MIEDLPSTGDIISENNLALYIYGYMIYMMYDCFKWLLH